MRPSTQNHSLVRLGVAGVFALGGAAAQAGQISFTQTASGGAARLLENIAPDVASRTDGASAVPPAGSVVRAQTGVVGVSLSTGTSGPTTPVTRTFDATVASQKDGLLVERRITATVDRNYVGSVFTSPTAGVGAPATVSRLDEVFTLSAPGFGLAANAITQVPFAWQCSGGPCVAVTGFSGRSPSFTLTDIKSYDPNRFDPRAPFAAGNFVDLGGGTVSLKYTPVQTVYPGNSSFATVDLGAEIRIEQVFRPWRTNEVLDVSASASGGAMTASVTPRFGFTTAEAAALGGYSGFNWLQRVTDMEVGGRRLTTEAERIAEFGRGLGVDPNTGDASPLYWDSSPVAGRPGLDAATHATAAGASFRDVPQLFEAGRKVYFETSLVGVTGSGFDVLATTFGDERFTFRWSFEQTADVTWTSELLDALGLLAAPTGGIAAMLQNINDALGGTGIFTFLGFGSASDIVDPGQPIPVPATLWLLGTGAIGLVLRRHAT